MRLLERREQLPRKTPIGKLSGELERVNAAAQTKTQELEQVRKEQTQTATAHERALKAAKKGQPQLTKPRLKLPERTQVALKAANEKATAADRAKTELTEQVEQKERERKRAVADLEDAQKTKEREVKGLNESLERSRKAQAELNTMIAQQKVSIESQTAVILATKASEKAAQERVAKANAERDEAVAAKTEAEAEVSRARKFTTFVEYQKWATHKTTLKKPLSANGAGAGKS